MSQLDPIELVETDVVSASPHYAFAGHTLPSPAPKRPTVETSTECGARNSLEIESEPAAKNIEIEIADFCDPGLGICFEKRPPIGSAMALSKLVLSDFSVLCQPASVPEGSWDGRQPLDVKMTAFEHMLGNLESLMRLGALTTHEGLPYEKVSGFEKTEGDDPEVLNPSDIFPHKTLRLLFWGAPHPNPSKCNGSHHGSMATAAKYKTEAFESMAWLCPTGLVAMTFPAKYKVEFYHPRNDTTATARILICTNMSARSYVPMASSNGLRYRIPQADVEDTMVSMLVPPAMWHCVTFDEAGCLIFGQTLRKALATLDDDEFGCALGVYDCSLEAELLADEHM